MAAQTTQNTRSWIGAGLVILVILAALYWWRDDLNQWIFGTSSTATDEPSATAPEAAAPEAESPEAPMSEAQDQAPSEPAVPEGSDASATGN